MAVAMALWVASVLLGVGLPVGPGFLVGIGEVVLDFFQRLVFGFGDSACSLHPAHGGPKRVAVPI